MRKKHEEKKEQMKKHKAKDERHSKMHEKDTKTGNIIHVKLTEPLHLRKQVLKTAILTAELLQSFGRMSAVKEEKKLRISELISTARGMARIAGSLKSVLPSIGEEKIEKKEEFKEERIAKEAEAIFSKSSELSELES